jgi:Leucine-rich repeat (LRR) protein
MKKLVYIIVLLTGITNAQIVTIPDANFKAKLIALGIDTNTDGNIQVSEALLPTTLTLSQSNISDMTGIGAFINLQSLDCHNNQITSLNVSNLTGLGIVNCSYNQLTSLNMSELTNLLSLNCNNNNLISLNVSGLVNLEALYCYDNQLTSLNVSGLSALKGLNCNTNQLTSLNVNGLTNLLGLYCYNNLIPSLTVTALPNLFNLDCSNNVLTTLNVSSLNSLQVLYCFGNQLNALNLSGIPALKWLDCNSNQLPSLDVSIYSNLFELKCHNNNINNLNVSGLTNLQLLNCSNNELSAIEVLGLTTLENLDCNTNQLSTIDISGLDALAFLDCSNNQLTSLISDTANLSILVCSGNQLTTLDVSSMTHLQQLACNDNELTSLFIKNGNNEQLFISNNPDLNFICADENQIAAIEVMILANGQTTVVNSYCNFSPGGDYNIILGTLTFDVNNNGCDANDLFEPNIRVNINDTESSGASFTNINGNYAFYTQAGTFSIDSSIENSSWFTFSPTSATISFTNNDNNVVTQDFCITPNGIHPDVEVVVVPLSTARPGFDASYKVVIRNKGNQTLSGDVMFSYDDEVLDFVSSDVTPNTNANGFLVYNYTNLLPFENRSFTITLNVNTPTDDPAVNIGDQLTFAAAVNPISGDENPADNEFQYHQTVVGSFDPNDITCIEGNVVSPSEIGNYLHYVINFENTGTADAENIVVREVIDPNQFDVSSLQLMNSSAPVTARLTGNVAEFIFQGINLHSGGHGNILIKVRSRNTLVTGDSVVKRANIFFDYNFPVETQPENTIFQSLSIPGVPVDASISVYPNPTKGTVNINCSNTIQSVQLYDIQGRILQTNLVNENQAILDISNQSNGVYFLKIISGKGMAIQKLVKE